jgi:hypothetical protein
VFVDHPCASTRLENVAVLDYRGFGIRQRGGSLTLTDVRVARTREDSASMVHGTGILLSCGVQARMSAVSLFSNDTSGLFLAGEGTEVTALGVEIRGTRAHSAFADPANGNSWGAIHVRDSARLELRGFSVVRNWAYGVDVDARGTALLEFGTIGNTLGLDRLFPSRSEFPAGMNALAAGGGQLGMRHFISTRADLCGLQIARDGGMDLFGDLLVLGGGRSRSTSEVSFSPIGVCLQVPGYDVARLTDGVVFRGNGTAVEATDLPVPEISDPSEP